MLAVVLVPGSEHGAIGAAGPDCNISVTEQFPVDDFQRLGGKLSWMAWRSDAVSPTQRVCVPNRLSQRRTVLSSQPARSAELTLDKPNVLGASLGEYSGQKGPWYGQFQAREGLEPKLH